MFVKTFPRTENSLSKMYEFKTQMKSNEFNRTDTLQRYDYNSLNIQSSLGQSKPKSQSLHRSCSLKHNVFKNAKQVEKTERPRSSSHKSLHSVNSFRNGKSNLSIKLQVPKHSNKEGGTVKEKKLAEEIISRLRNKNSVKLSIRNPNEKVSDKELRKQELLQFNSSNANSGIFQQAEVKSKNHSHSALHDSSVSQSQKWSKKVEEMQRMEKIFQEKSNLILQKQSEIDKKIHLFQNMAENFNQFIQNREKEFLLNIQSVKAQQMQRIQQLKREMEQKQKEILKREMQTKQKESKEIKYKKTSIQASLGKQRPHNPNKEVKQKHQQKYVTRSQAKLEQKQEQPYQGVAEQKTTQNSPQIKISQANNQKIKKTNVFETDQILFDQLQEVSLQNRQNQPKPTLNRKPSKQQQPTKNLSDNTTKPFLPTNNLPQEIKEKGPSKTNAAKQSQAKTLQNLKNPQYKKQPQRQQLRKMSTGSVSGKQSQKNPTSDNDQKQPLTKKQKEQHQRNLLLQNAISRVVQLLYFIGQIPHHYTQHMKKNKKFGFKLACLYLMKYVYDKFRYLEGPYADLCRKKVISQKDFEERVSENQMIKVSYVKFKVHSYKKEPFPPKQSERYLNEESNTYCFQDPGFFENFVFKEIKDLFEHYHNETKGNFNEHPVNLCYYRMILAYFMIKEIQYDEIIIEVEEGSDVPNYMVQQIDKYSQNQLRQRLEQCYEILFSPEE